MKKYIYKQGSGAGLALNFSSINFFQHNLMVLAFKSRDGTVVLKAASFTPVQTLEHSQLMVQTRNSIILEKNLDDHEKFIKNRKFSRYSQNSLFM